MENDLSNVPVPQSRRRRMYPTTEVREYRLRFGLTLQEVAACAGLTLTRASYVERNPAIASSDELVALRRAIHFLLAQDDLAGASDAGLAAATGVSDQRKAS